MFFSNSPDIYFIWIHNADLFCEAFYTENSYIHYLITIIFFPSTIRTNNIIISIKHWTRVFLKEIHYFSVNKKAYYGTQLNGHASISGLNPLVNPFKKYALDPFSNFIDIPKWIARENKRKTQSRVAPRVLAYFISILREMRSAYNLKLVFIEFVIGSHLFCNLS